MCFRQRCRENQNTLFIFNIRFPKIMLYIKYYRKYGTARETTCYNIIRFRNIGFTCAITKARIQRHAGNV